MCEEPCPGLSHKESKFGLLGAMIKIMHTPSGT